MMVLHDERILKQISPGPYACQDLSQKKKYAPDVTIYPKHYIKTVGADTAECEKVLRQTCDHGVRELQGKCTFLRGNSPPDSTR